MTYLTNFWNGSKRRESGIVASRLGAREDALNGDVRIGVRRDGCLVHISLRSDTESLCIELHEHLVRSIKKGSVRLEIGSQ